MINKISNIEEHTDIEVDILQYIQSNCVVDNIIRDLDAGNQIDITITTFFAQSNDYQILKEKIKKQNRLVNELRETKQMNLFLIESNNLRKLVTIEKTFVKDIMKLADTLIKININSERIKAAKIKFNEGKFLEADKMLIERELIVDQEDLLFALEHLEYREETFLKEYMNLL